MHHMAKFTGIMNLVAEDGTEAGKSAAEEQANNLSLDDLQVDKPAAKAPTGDSGSEAGLEAVYDIPVRVSAVLGETHMQIHQLLKLGRGAVVELDRRVGEAIDIYVNDRLVARGEVVIVDDKLGVTMTEVVKAK